MGYNFRNSTRRFRRFGIKQYSYKRSGYFPNVAKIASDLKAVKSLINVERKFIDTGLSGQTVSSTGALSLTSGVATGTDNVTRVGDSIKYNSFEAQGFVTLNASATQDYVRVSIVQDMAPNGTIPAYTDIYEGAGPLAYRNKLKVDRFRVLKEFRLDLDTNGNVVQKFKWFHKFPNGKDSHEKFSGNTAAATDIYSNAIYITYSGTQATNTASLNVNTRIRYVDN